MNRQEVPRKLFCDKCQEVFPLKESIKEKLVDKDVEWSYIQCPHCGAIFTIVYSNREFRANTAKIQKLSLELDKYYSSQRFGSPFMKKKKFDVKAFNERNKRVEEIRKILAELEKQNNNIARELKLKYERGVEYNGTVKRVVR